MSACILFGAKHVTDGGTDGLTDWLNKNKGGSQKVLESVQFGVTHGNGWKAPRIAIFRCNGHLMDRPINGPMDGWANRLMDGQTHL